VRERDSPATNGTVPTPCDTVGDPPSISDAGSVEGRTTGARGSKAAPAVAGSVSDWPADRNNYPAERAGSAGPPPDDDEGSKLVR